MRNSYESGFSNNYNYNTSCLNTMVMPRKSHVSTYSALSDQYPVSKSDHPYNYVTNNSRHSINRALNSTTHCVNVSYSNKKISQNNSSVLQNSIHSNSNLLF